MINLKKIIFLIKSGSSLRVIIAFCLNKIWGIFLRRKIISYKRNHQSLLKDKKINNDYFSSHSYNFFIFLKNLKDNFNYLEIGSYEGNSALFVADCFRDSNITCIDNWTSTEEYKDHISFSKIEANFDYNTRNFENIKKIKLSSDSFFENNQIFFDAIYVDGHHLASQVYKDCLNSWKFLNKNGYLICDDYIWSFYKNLRDNPCYAINRFLKEIKGSFKIEKVSNSQIFIKKK